MPNHVLYPLKTILLLLRDTVPVTHWVVAFWSFYCFNRCDLSNILQDISCFLLVFIYSLLNLVQTLIDNIMSLAIATYDYIQCNNVNCTIYVFTYTTLQYFSCENKATYFYYHFLSLNPKKMSLMLLENTAYLMTCVHFISILTLDRYININCSLIYIINLTSINK